MENKNFVLMIGLELKREMTERGLTQEELAEKICQKSPYRQGDETKPRNKKTTRDHLSRMITGKALNFETFNIAMEVLEVQRVAFLK